MVAATLCMCGMGKKAPYYETAKTRSISIVLETRPTRSSSNKNPDAAQTPIDGKKFTRASTTISAWHISFWIAEEFVGYRQTTPFGRQHSDFSNVRIFSLHENKMRTFEKKPSWRNERFKGAVLSFSFFLLGSLVNLTTTCAIFFFHVAIFRVHVRKTGLHLAHHQKKQTDRFANQRRFACGRFACLDFSRWRRIRHRPNLAKRRR